MPFNRPTLSTLVERARDDLDARLPGADSRLRRSALDVLARVHAGAVDGLHGFQQWISRQILPDTSEGEVLARQAAIWGLQRKAAMSASGSIRVTGANGAELPAGTALLRGDGVEYLTTAAAVLAGGAAIAGVRAVEAGRGGNAEPGTRLTFVSPVPGVNAVAQVAAGAIGGGDDQESDDALRARLLDRIRRPPHGGSRSDYERWALEVAGVTRAWVTPGVFGPGTVGLQFVADGRANIIPTADEVAVVQAYLDPLRPVTAELFVTAPIAFPVALLIRAIPSTAAVKAAIAAEVEDLLAREAVPGGTILISHLREAISLAAGEHDHELVQPAGNVQVGPGYLVVPGPIHWVGG